MEKAAVATQTQGEIVIESMTRAGTVSYTHLDVYKRQTTSRFFSMFGMWRAVGTQEKFSIARNCRFHQCQAMLFAF